MAGDLTGVCSIAGTGDELDRLAENLNAMLDRIGVLMARACARFPTISRTTSRRR